MASPESDESEYVLAEEEQISEVVEEISTKHTEVDNLVTAELVFPFKSSPLVVAGIPEIYLPLCGAETLSNYHCQFLSCTFDFAQKAVACNHVCCDHLNIVLACLHCSFESNPKMQWYSASAWQHHSLKHLKDNLPVYPDDPTFLNISWLPLVMVLFPVPQDKACLIKKRSVNWAKAAKKFFEEELDLCQVSSPGS